MDINFLSTFSDVLLAWVDVKYSYKFVRKTATVKFSPTQRRKKSDKLQFLGITGQKQLSGADQLVMN